MVQLVFRSPVRLGQRGQASEILRSRGAIIPAQTGQPSSVAARLQQQGQTVSPPETLQAMVDTGASISGIDDAVARRLGLIPTGSVSIGGVTGRREQPVYAASLVVSGQTYDPITLAGVSLGGLEFQVLIGRDILRDMNLSYVGPTGQFSMSAGSAPSPVGVQAPISPAITPSIPIQVTSQAPDIGTLALIGGGILVASLLAFGVFGDFFSPSPVPKRRRPLRARPAFST